MSVALSVLSRRSSSCVYGRRQNRLAQQPRSPDTRPHCGRQQVKGGRCFCFAFRGIFDVLEMPTATRPIAWRCRRVSSILYAQQAAKRHFEICISAPRQGDFKHLHGTGVASQYLSGQMALAKVARIARCRFCCVGKDSSHQKLNIRNFIV